MSFQSLPGFRDFYPEDCAHREHLFEVWRRSAEAFGFVRYDGPPLEPLDLFRKKSGDEIVGQLYNFTDKGEREVAMRPEMTPTLARMAGARHRDYKKPLKWYAIPQLFRYERTQRGRLREHFQWNCDILGEPGLGGEAELIGVIVHALRALGLGQDDIVVRVSDRHFWIDFLKEHNVPEEKHYDFLQILDKIEREDEAKSREKLGPLADTVFKILREGARSERLDQLLGLLDAMGLREFIQVDLSIVRGLAYYTGIVFEVHDRKKEFRAIAGGGRYDNLVELLSGVPLTALGFGMGDVVILELLKSRGLLAAPVTPLDFYVVVADETARPQALRLITALRASGKRIDYSLSPAKVGKQFQAAEERGASRVLVIDAAAAEGKCGLKDLKTREQQDVTFTYTDGGVTFTPPL